MIKWPNACVGCGIDDNMGITRYEFRIGDPEKHSDVNYRHAGLYGKGAILLCDMCREQAILEQKILVRERTISLLVSIGVLFLIPALIFPSAMSAIMSFLFIVLFLYSAPTILSIIRLSKVRNLEPFHSYLSFSVESKWNGPSNIRVELRNLQYTILMKDINDFHYLRIENRPKMRIASVKSNDTVTMCAMFAIIPAAFIAPVFLILFLMGTSIEEVLKFILPYLGLLLIPYLVEYIHLRIGNRNH